ncbi:ankyrin repeat-containing domain protein [Aspergillus carlsbadensis]|nr:ankyrin repeat-containing domain protein [Aspergillus carlsbadensis]
MEPKAEEALPISLAAAAGDVTKVTALLDAEPQGFNIYNLMDIALVYAAGNGHVPVVKFLLGKGAKVATRRGFMGTGVRGAYRARFVAQLAANTTTALDLAVKNKQSEAVKILLRSQQTYLISGAWRLWNKQDRGSLFMTALQTAVAENDLDMAEMLIRAGVHVRYWYRCDSCAHLDAFRWCSACGDIRGRTALHLAAELGYAGMVDLLLRHGASRTVKPGWRAPPLHLAAEGGHDRVVWMLLEHGAAIDELDKNRLSALYVAARRGRAKTFQLLRSRGADSRETARRLLKDVAAKDEEPGFNKSAAVEILLPDICSLSCDEVKDHFFSAISNRNALVLSALLRHPGIIQSIGFIPRSYEFRLITSSGYGDLVEALIEHWPWRAEANLAALSGMFNAGGSGSIRACEAFLNWQAKCENRDVYLLCGLLGAVDKSRDATTEWLVKGGASVNLLDMESLSFLRKELGIFYLNPLHVAVAGSSSRICEVLITNGADVNGRHIQRGPNTSKAKTATLTPLHLAAESSRADVAKLLLRNGARTEDTDGDGRTALHIAAHRDAKATVETLVQRGADIEARDARGMTPLHVAGAALSTGAYAELVRLGADISARDGSGLCAAELQDLARRVVT